MKFMFAQFIEGGTCVVAVRPFYFKVELRSMLLLVLKQCVVTVAVDTIRWSCELLKGNHLSNTTCLTQALFKHAANNVADCDDP